MSPGCSRCCGGRERQLQARRGWGGSAHGRGLGGALRRGGGACAGGDGGAALRRERPGRSGARRGGTPDRPPTGARLAGLFSAFQRMLLTCVSMCGQFDFGLLRYPRGKKKIKKRRTWRGESLVSWLRMGKLGTARQRWQRQGAVGCDGARGCPGPRRPPGWLGLSWKKGGDRGSGQVWVGATASTVDAFDDHGKAEERGREKDALGSKLISHLLAGVRRSYYKPSRGGCMQNRLKTDWFVNSSQTWTYLGQTRAYL